MAGAMLMPDSRFRSPTAVADKADVRDENVTSAVVLAYGGAGVQKTFTVPQGQAIPSLKGSSITLAQAHHLLFTEATTNLTKAGELGSGIGDASIRAIGLRLEQAPYYTTTSSSVIDAYGATQQEFAECASKLYFQLKIANKPQIQGGMTQFPSLGGLFGVVSTTANAATLGLVTNGAMGGGRRLKLPILAARNDTIEGVVGVAGSASLVFRTATGAGAETLLYTEMQALIKGDVR